MSILIKGMEMPMSCDECEFCERAISGYDWCSVPMVKGRSKPLDEPVIKPDWCPLTELPPHGRLIDADEFYKSLKKWYAKFYSAYEKDKKDERIAALLELDLLVRKVLENAPTIIPAEEV